MPNTTAGCQHLRERCPDAPHLPTSKTPYLSSPCVSAVVPALLHHRCCWVQGRVPPGLQPECYQTAGDGWHRMRAYVVTSMH